MSQPGVSSKGTPRQSTKWTVVLWGATNSGNRWGLIAKWREFRNVVRKYLCIIHHHGGMTSTFWMVYMDGNRRDSGGEYPSRYVRDGEQSPREDQSIQKSQTQQPGGMWWSVCHLQGPLFFFHWLHGWHHLTSHLQSCLESQGQGETAAGLSKRLKGSTPCDASSVLPPPHQMTLIFSLLFGLFY